MLLTQSAANQTLKPASRSCETCSPYYQFRRIIRQPSGVSRECECLLLACQGSIKPQMSLHHPGRCLVGADIILSRGSQTPRGRFVAEQFGDPLREAGI